MSLYKEFGTSNKKEEGIKVEPMAGFFFTIKRSGGSNKAYSEAATRRLRPFVQRFNSGKNIPLDTIQEINIELFVEYILLGWSENVTDRSGNQLPFTKDNAKKLLQDLPELYSFLSDEAGNLDNFKD
ncbi:MAG: hypothetical protein ACHQYQ_09945, partial [Bacteriovoracales bacterium]